MTDRRTSIPAALAGAALLLAGSAAAARADVLSSSGAADYPTVTAQSGGGLEVSWTENVTKTSAIRSATSTSGGTFAAPVTVLALTDRDRFAFDAPAADGSHVVVWQRTGKPYRRVRFALVAADGSRGPSTKLSPLGHSAGVPSVVGNAAGDAIACWSQYDGAAWQQQCAIHKAGTRGFGAPLTLAGGADKDKFAPVPALAADGKLVVAYESPTQILAAQGSVAGGIGAGKVVDAHALNYASVSAAVANDGSAVLTSTSVNGAAGATQQSVVHAVRLGADGNATPAQTLSAPGGIQPGDLEAPALTALSDGSFLASWVSGASLVASSAPAGSGAFATAAPVAPVPLGEAENVRLAAGANASAALVWTVGQTRPDKRGLYAVVQLARLRAGAWTPPTAISSATEQALTPAVALAADGSTGVGWVQSLTGGGEGDLQGAVLAP